MFVAGEVFLRFRPRRPEDGLAVPLQIQMLPSEMLPLHLGLPSRLRDGSPGNERAGNGNVIRQGIEFDRIGRHVADHVLRRHPGDVTDQGVAGETVRVPTAEVIHVIDPVDAGQLRGVSRFAPGIVKLSLLDQYDDAELDRKKVAAMRALFITTPAPRNRSASADGEKVLFKNRAGATVGLGNGALRVGADRSRRAWRSAPPPRFVQRTAVQACVL